MLGNTMIINKFESMRHINSSSYLKFATIEILTTFPIYTLDYGEHNSHNDKLLILLKKFK